MKLNWSVTKPVSDKQHVAAGCSWMKDVPKLSLWVGPDHHDRLRFFCPGHSGGMGAALAVQKA